jgi:hypothetical protein
MKQREDTERHAGSSEEPRPVARKPYHKPTFRHEHVFEVNALNCGKVQSTTASCHNARKTS